MLRALGLLSLAAALSQDFTYTKPWDPFRRSSTECEMCHEGNCLVRNDARCEYYAEASKGFDEDDDNVTLSGQEEAKAERVDSMLFELVDSASLAGQSCVPFASQYTDCTKENICTGCTFWICNEEGRWLRGSKQACRPVPKMDVDQRMLGIVLESLKRKEKSQNREKRSLDYLNTVPIAKDKLTYRDISEWMYDLEPNNNGQPLDIEHILEYFNINKTSIDGVEENSTTSLSINTNGFPLSTSSSTNRNENYIDLLEFNDILLGLATEEYNTNNPLEITPPTFTKQNHSQSNLSDIDNIDYDPIRLIKRDTLDSQKNKSLATLQINATTNNFTFEQILRDALQGITKITNEKQIELEELFSIRDNLSKIAKTHNVTFNFNTTITRDNYNKHHIAIYKLDTYTKCVAVLKRDIYDAIGNDVQTAISSHSSDLPKDLIIFFDSMKKYILREHDNFISKKNVNDHEDCKLKTIQDRNLKNFNPISHLSNILAEMNKSTSPMQTLRDCGRKILKRVIKQLYSEDIAVIDHIVHETYNDIDSYLENVGTKWKKMLQDIVESGVSEKLFRIKLLHITLEADIGKMQDIVTLLEFARNRRMSVVNGAIVDKSLSRIKNNLALIHDNVNKIISHEKSKNLREAQNQLPKKQSIIQKLKKIFRNSKNDIRNMLKKNFSKSEIMKKITRKRMNELEKQRMLDYQESMKRWQDTNTDSERRKRSVWWFGTTFADRIKSIIPGYLKRKVHPAIQQKKAEKTQSTRADDGKKEKTKKPLTAKTSNISRKSI